MQIRKRSYGLGVGAAALLSIAALSAGAAVAQETSQVVVSYADLDLSRTPGVAALYRRISFAAQKVCSAYDGRIPAQHANFNSCKLDAAHRAIADVAVPALTEYYNARSGATRGNERIAGR